MLLRLLCRWQFQVVLFRRSEMKQFWKIMGTIAAVGLVAALTISGGRMRALGGVITNNTSDNMTVPGDEEGGIYWLNSSNSTDVTPGEEDPKPADGGSSGGAAVAQDQNSVTIVETPEGIIMKSAREQMKQTQYGNLVVIRTGFVNSYSKAYMEEVSELVAAGKHVVFINTWNKAEHVVWIPALSTVDLTKEWSGPQFMSNTYTDISDAFSKQPRNLSEAAKIWEIISK